MGVGVVANVVRACIPCGPKCLKWKLLMESGPVAGEFLMLLMTCLFFMVRRVLRCGLLDRKAYV